MNFAPKNSHLCFRLRLISDHTVHMPTCAFCSMVGENSYINRYTIVQPARFWMVRFGKRAHQTVAMVVVFAAAAAATSISAVHQPVAVVTTVKQQNTTGTNCTILHNSCSLYIRYFMCETKRKNARISEESVENWKWKTYYRSR